MLIIYTRPNGIFKKERLKHVLSRITGKLRGPRAVLESMRRGLNALHVPYRVNPSYRKIRPEDVVHVVSGAETLRECVELKKQGIIRKLIAGPSIAVIPSEEQELLLDPSIDAVLVPSDWVKDLYARLNPELSGKTFAWFAGVNVSKSKPRKNSEKEIDYLIYYKNADPSLLTFVESQLVKRHKSFKKVIYGEFEQADFFRKLKKSKAMIYLSPSESQGLALNEAWMRDVPTLVWDRGYWEYKDVRWEHEKISAPYLTDELGLTFGGESDFVQKLELFELKLADFRPKEYSLEHFTDEKSVQNLLGIIDSNNV